MTKSQWELKLNGMVFEELPKEFRKLLTKASKAKRGTKYGERIRSNHREVFDKWVSSQTETKDGPSSTGLLGLGNSYLQKILQNPPNSK